MPNPQDPTTSVPNPPWWASGQQSQQQQRLIQQIQKIKPEFPAGGGIRVYPNDAQPAGMQFMYRERTLLTRTSNAPMVLQALGLSPSAASVNPDLPDLTSIALPNTPAFANLKAVIDRVAQDPNAGPGLAHPDHVIHISGTGGSCPATEPVPALQWSTPRPTRQNPAHPGTGAGVKVAVVDTGLLTGVANQHTWLNDNKVYGGPEQGTVGHYQGHGTFVAGVIRGIAPDTEIQLEALLYRKGAMTEGQLVGDLAKALTWNPDIISVSAGTSTLDSGTALGFEVFHEKLVAEHPKTVVVAAAGNDGSGTEHFYPGSFGWAIGVGALNLDRTRAGYSNFGDSADVFAFGTDLVNAYPTGNYTYQEAPLAGQHANFQNGMAYWAGTSFSTPLVSGLIAAWMHGFNVDAKTAWQGLKAKADARTAQFGYPYLLPDD